MNAAKAILVVGTAATILAASAANASTITASFTTQHAMTAHVQSLPLTGNVTTVSFNWTRIDHLGVGVDSTVPQQYPTFCIELDQHVHPGTTYTYNVMTPGEYGFSPDTELALQNLWAAHIGELSTGDKSCAFQLAVWELRYDTDRSLSTGAFSATGPAGAIAIAQAWLGSVGSAPSFTGLPALSVLTNADSQDQITVVPEPGAIVCVLSGLALLRRRRTR